MIPLAEPVTCMVTNLAGAVRVLRMRSGFRQEDLAARCGVSRQLVSKLERGEFRHMTLRGLEQLVEALDARLDLRVVWRGEQLDRLIDAAHASLQEATAALLSKLDWDVRLEVSFNHFGDRGRVDILAFNAKHRILLVVEVKSAFGDLQETLGRLAIKTRLGQVLARDCNWPIPESVVPALVIADTRAARRLISSHRAMFVSFDVRGRSAHAWLRHPGIPARGLIWFASGPNSRAGSAIGRQRVRRPLKHRNDTPRRH